jgi:hypothetical protein
MLSMSVSHHRSQFAWQVLTSLDYVNPCIYHRCDVRYLVRGDDPKTQEIKVPALATMLMKRDEDGNLKSYKMEVFIDPSPVFARISEKGL